MRPVRLVSLVLGLVLLVGACGSGSDEAALVLDGSPRISDDEGIVTAIDVEALTLTLDGDRDYEISDSVRSFSALDLSVQALADAAGAYAQVGLDGDTVTWLGRIAEPVSGGQNGARVFYVGRFKRFENAEPKPPANAARRVVFGEGTVIAVADGVMAPDGAVDQILQAEIDPTTHAIVALTGT